jgi:Yip1 domain
MALNALLARVTGMLTSPSSEWPRVAAEPTTAADLYRQYILILAALPALAGFIKMSFVGVHVPFMGTIHVGAGTGLKSTLVSYGLTLAAVYLMALLVNTLAPTFGGEKNSLQALKTVAYAYTASWVASVAQLLPWIGVLITLAGGVYSIYLLYLGLPHTMKCPVAKAKGYTAVTIVVALLVGWTVALVAGKVSGLSADLYGTGRMHGEDSGDLRFDKDSPLARLEALGKSAEEASRKLEEAQKSGDTRAQNQAMREMVGAVLGGGTQVEALAPERLKPFVPETLAGMPRSDYSAERNTAMGMQIASAEASYTDNSTGRSLRLQINDMGSTKGLMAFASWAGMQQERESDSGYEKSYNSGGRMVHEQWDSANRHGEYSVVLAERFVVKVSGNADSMEVLKSALNGIDLAGLEALRNEGVKSD